MRKKIFFCFPVFYFQNHRARRTLENFQSIPLPITGTFRSMAIPPPMKGYQEAGHPTDFRSHSQEISAYFTPDFPLHSFQPWFLSYFLVLWRINLHPLPGDRSLRLPSCLPLPSFFRVSSSFNHSLWDLASNSLTCIFSKSHHPLTIQGHC